MNCPCKAAVALWQKHNPDEAWVRCETHAFTHWDSERRMAYQGNETWEYTSWGMKGYALFRATPAEPIPNPDSPLGFTWPAISHPSLVPPNDQIVQQDFDAFFAAYFPREAKP